MKENQVLTDAVLEFSVDGLLTKKLLGPNGIEVFVDVKPGDFPKSFSAENARGYIEKNFPLNGYRVKGLLNSRTNKKTIHYAFELEKETV